MCFSTLIVKKISTIAKLSVACASFLIFLSCSPSPSNSTKVTPPLPAPAGVAASVKVLIQSLDLETSLSVKQLVVEYVAQVDSDFTDLRAELASLQKNIESLLESPSPSTLANGRESWESAHQSYHQSNLHLYFTSLISTESQSDQLYQMAYQMDHWPILAGYVDSVGGYEAGGIVHDVNVELSPESLKQQHGLFDVTEATLGFHVIEFLLWGESDVNTAPRGFEDFAPVNQLTNIQRESGMEISQIGNNRRRELLRLISEILLEDFSSSFAIWVDASTSFLKTTVDRSPAALLNLLLESSTAMLTEELLIRSLYPLLNGEYESGLQSPYSQTSEITVAAQLQSVERLLLETPTSNGVTLDKLLSSMSPVFEEFFYENLDSNKACLILLYSSFGQTNSYLEDSTIEFEVVECINLLTNLIDQLEQIKLTLPVMKKPV
jgi:hypothetical protein